MKKLFLMRHGESDGNKRGVFAGTLDTPLADTGISQAKKAGIKIKQDGHFFDLIMASPLQRAQNTAKYIAKETDYPLDRIETSDLVIERSFGVLEGTLVDDFFKDHELKHLDDVDQAETLEQMHARAEKLLEFVRSKTEANILIVSHGAFGRALRRVINEQPHTHEYHPESTRIGNCEIIELI